MWLLVGLGNPGAEYARQRHNIGFLALDTIAERYHLGPFRQRFKGLVAEGRIDSAPVLLLKPQTYMNLSGESVAAAARFYRIEPDHIVVFHDELDLVPGKLRTKLGGGTAGHNGLRSIDTHLGPDFRRVRMGIGHPGHRDMVSGYVLHDFAKADRDWLVKLLDAVADAVPLLLQGDEAGFMNRVALLTQPERPKPPRPEAGRPAPSPETRD